MERVLSLLDQPEAVAERDPGRSLDAVASLPAHVREAAAAGAAAGARLPGTDDIDHVVVCGMGGSAVGGDVLAALARAAGPVPVVVHRGYGAPAHVGPRTLVVASSYSGGTEETLDAFRAARDRGATGLAITIGGRLGDEASAAGWEVIAPTDGLMPRFALGWMTAAPAAALEAAGLLRPAVGWADGAPVALGRRVSAWGPGAPTDANPAKGLAHALLGASPVIWGAEGASGVAAVRWKNDLNENAKVAAHAAVLPELDHNEIVGLAAEGRQGRPTSRSVLVCLRESVEDERVGARFVASTREVAASFELVWEARGEGDDALVRFLDLALLGGFVSVYLALLRGVDPVPIEAIARLKSALA